MQRVLLYIVNPISGTNSKEHLKELIQQETTKAGLPFEMVNSVPDANYSFLLPTIREKGVTDIIVVGGDGTVNGAIGNLHSLDVQFGIIPCGSGNGLAFSARISKDHPSPAAAEARMNPCQRVARIGIRSGAWTRPAWQRCPRVLQTHHHR